MKLSQMACSIEPSLTRRLFNMAHEYGDTIDLTLGDPDFSPASFIQDAAVDAVRQGHTHYSANAGLAELRKTYSNFINREYGTSYNPESDIIVTVGGMEALFLSLATIVDPGDEVVILGPYYVNYYQMTRMLGGIPVVVDSLSDPNKVALDLEAAISDKTVAAIINSPCNPSGRIIDQKIVDAVARLSLEHDFYVISDEVYRSLVYEGENTSIIRNSKCRDRSILIDSMSKRYSMTGYRLGFAVSSPVLIAAMTKMQENVAACAPLPSQYAAIAAYSGKQDDSIREAFRKRRDVICDALSKSSRNSYKQHDDTIYLFVEI